MEAVIIEPANQQLVFTPEESSGNLSAVIRIHNTAAATHSLLFRVQTTSPLHYRVRPSHGRVEPNDIGQVQIAFVSDSKKADKFLVKWVVVERDVEGEFNEVWQRVTEGPDAQTVHEQRLKCILPTTTSSSPAPSTEGGSVEKSTLNAPIYTFSSAAQSKENVSVDGEGDLKAKLAEAQNKNAELSKKIAQLESELAIRKRAVSPFPAATDSGILTQEQHERGMDALLAANQGNVPPVLVVLIAIFCFFLGLLF